MSNPATEGELIFSIEPENKLVRASFTGRVAIEQVKRVMEDIRNAPGYQTDFDSLVDFRGFTGTWTTDEIRQLAQKIREAPIAPGTRRAVIVQDDVQYELMKLLEGFTFLAPVLYRSFRSQEAAVEWLHERRPSRSAV